jgi:hypothetical protein
MPAPQLWYCPNCDAAARTSTDTLPMHACPGLHDLNIPLVKHGTKCKIEAVEREDYVGREMVQTGSHGRPIMSVITTRDDGQDCTIYPPAAFAERGEL